jgi:hypothetical protein
MDTSEVAAIIGTHPRQLRAFLRSPISTFVAVGSGARYEFTETDIPLIKKRFTEWQGQGKPKATTTPASPARTTTSAFAKARTARLRDQAVWEEEGAVVIPDIRDPRIRREVKERARRAEEALNLRLLAVGLHITQGATDSRRKAS